MNFAPILLLVYNRPYTTKKIVANLVNHPNIGEMELFVFSDGPKFEHDLDSIEEVRKIIENLHVCKKLNKYYSEKNLGLANSVISGINKVFENNNKIIVLEDDLEISPFFLEYMNFYLTLYETNINVGTIQGFQFPIKSKSKEPVFFDKFVNCWGWGTWKNRWSDFEHDGAKLQSALNNRHLTYEFDGQNSYPFSNLLDDQINGLVDSWAIRWYASLFLKETIHLYPNKSLVINNGLDGSGTHGEKKWFIQTIHEEEFELTTPEPKLNSIARNSVIKYRKQIRRKLKISNFIKRFQLNVLKPILKSIQLNGKGNF